MGNSGKIPGFIRKSLAVMLAVALAAVAGTGAAAKTTHDELDYTVTVGAKRSTITVDPNNNRVVNPATGDVAGQTAQFTVTGKIGSSVTINAGSADTAHIRALEESDTSTTNVVGFTYTFGATDENVKVRWKDYTTYFNGNGGTAEVGSKTTEYNHTNTLPNASKANYVFQGWFTAASGGTNVGGNGAVYTQGAAQPTYYAQWSCGHPANQRTKTITSYGGWGAWNTTTHTRTRTNSYKITCNVCGAQLSTGTEVETQTATSQTNTITVHYPTKNSVSGSGSQTVTTKRVTYTRWSDGSSSAVSYSGTVDTSNWTVPAGTFHFQGWSTAGGSSGSPNHTVSYNTLQAAANAGHTGNLYTVHKGTWANHTSWYNGSGHYHSWNITTGSWTNG